MTRTSIRRAAAGDEQALSLVAGATFLETFAGVVDGGDIVAHCVRQHAADRYAAHLADPACALFLAALTPGEAPVGYCMLCPPSDMPIADPRADDLEIKRIYLLSRFHGGGAGRMLMQAALDEAQARHAGRVLIGVKDDNARAIGFYRKTGFEIAGTRSFRVGDGVYTDLLLARDMG